MPAYFKMLKILTVYRSSHIIKTTKHLKYTSRFQSARAHQKSWQDNPFIQYLRALKWVPIPLGVGFAYISYQQFGHILKREERKIQRTADPEDLLAKEWVVSLYKLFPLKGLSRAWGKVNNLELPMWLRKPIYKSYTWAFGCNLDEAAIRDLGHYRNLGEFFKRRLKPGARPINKTGSLVCPSDGCILYFGKADLGRVEQVKGISYSLWDFLGPDTWNQLPEIRQKQEELKNDHVEPEAQTLTKYTGPKGSQYQANLKVHPDNDLFHCIIYLAPGDYHGFHSPTEWSVNFRRYFPGELFSVNPGVARLIKGLFNFNERAVYTGNWKHGFFAMAAVGATNVGSIKVYHDKDLETNLVHKYPAGAFQDVAFIDTNNVGLEMQRGDAFGEFNLGSTIVLVFEAPKNFKFTTESGQCVKMGQILGSLKEEEQTADAA